jgi:hypothetical protein
MVVTARVLEQFNLGNIAGSCEAVNTAPVANAGADQPVVVMTVTLDGSASSDADGQALAFRWSSSAGRDKRCVLSTDRRAAHLRLPTSRATTTCN